MWLWLKVDPIGFPPSQRAVLVCPPVERRRGVIDWRRSADAPTMHQHVSVCSLNTAVRSSKALCRSCHHCNQKLNVFILVISPLPHLLLQAPIRPSHKSCWIGVLCLTFCPLSRKWWVTVWWECVFLKDSLQECCYLWEEGLKNLCHLLSRLLWFRFHLSFVHKSVKSWMIKSSKEKHKRGFFALIYKVMSCVSIDHIIMQIGLTKINFLMCQFWKNLHLR